MIAAVAFILTAVAFCVLALLAVLRITHTSMSSSRGVERDGLHRGVAAPRWSRVDSSGRDRCSPPIAGLQAVVLADHSLKSFPAVVQGLTNLTATQPGLEVLVLLRSKNDIAETMLRLLGLGNLPVVTGSPALYARYNVRALPWLMFVDSSGRVRASSLVNEGWQIDRLWRLACVPLAPAPRPASRRLPWRRVSAEV